MSLLARRPDRDVKETQEWGQRQAEALWENLYAGYGAVIDGATVLDLGCSWGYLLKFLAERFRPARLIGTDVRPHWQEQRHGWDYSCLGDLIEFHAGQLPDIEALRDRSVDLILCTSVLQYMTPDEVESNLERAYDLLVPGGEMLVRTRVFTSYIGADLHGDIELPYAHLLFGEPEIEAYMKDRLGKEPPYLNWLTASTYLALFVRAGFEVIEPHRRMNNRSPKLIERVSEEYPWIEADELLCAELEARLVRPFEPEDLAGLGSG